MPATRALPAVIESSDVSIFAVVDVPAPRTRLDRLAAAAIGLGERFRLDRAALPPTPWTS